MTEDDGIENLSLHEFMEEHPDRVLHGWGQSGSRWQDEAIPYFREVGIPTLVSDYVSMARLKDDENALADLESMRFWTDENGGRFEFIIMECLTNELDLTEVIDALLELGYDIDPDDPGVRDTVIELLQDPQILEAVIDLIGYPDVRVTEGEYDEEIIRLAEAVAAVERPVLVRFMQEFIGGKHHDDVSGPGNFKIAWRHFVDLMRSEGATNAEFVWHPNKGDSQTLEEWWPGDDYVDWIAVSVFQGSNFDKAEEHNQFAVSRGKPFLIAESAPTLNEFSGRGTREASTWDDFFVPYFDMIRSNSNIKAFFYINIDWSNSQFDWPITRVQENDVIHSNYMDEVTRDTYFSNNEFWTEAEGRLK